MSATAWGGAAALAGVVVFVVTVVALHLLQPGYDPASQLIDRKSVV